MKKRLVIFPYSFSVAMEYINIYPDGEDGGGSVLAIFPYIIFVFTSKQNLVHRDMCGPQDTIFPYISVS